MFSTQELLQQVQASRKEVFAALEEFGAVLVDGVVRVVEKSVRRETMRNVMQLLIERDWDIATSALSEETCLRTFQDAAISVDPVILQVVLIDLSKCDGSGSSTGLVEVTRDCTKSWQLNPNNVRKATAELLLTQLQEGRLGGGNGAEVHSDTTTIGGMKAIQVSSFVQEWALTTPGMLSVGGAEMILLRSLGTVVTSNGNSSGGGRIQDNEEYLVYFPAEVLLPLSAKVIMHINCHYPVYNRTYVHVSFI